MKLSKKNNFDINELYRIIFNQSLIGVSILSIDGRWLEVNKSLCKITGYSKKELLTFKFNQITHPEDKHRGSDAIKKLILGKINHLNLEKRYIRKNGSIAWVNLSISIIRDLKGIPKYFITHTEDISSEKENQIILKESEEKYRLLVENSPDAIVVYSKGLVVFANNEFFNMMRTKISKDIIGKKLLEFIHPDSKNIVIERMNKTIKEKMVLPSVNEKFIRLDGTCIETEIKSIPIKYKGEDAIQVLIRDISERKKSEYFLNLVLGNIPDFVFWKDSNSKFLGCNNALAKLIGLNNPSEIIGKSDYDFSWKKSESESFIRDDQEVMSTDKPKLHIIEPQLQPGGRQAWLETSKVPLHNDQGKVIGILGSFVDITNKKLIEEKLKESEEKYRKLFESAKDSIIILDSDTGKIVNVNPYFCNLFEYESSELVGSVIYKLDIFKKIIENKEKYKDLQENYFFRDGNLSILTKSGKIKYIEFSSNFYWTSGKKLIQCNIHDLTEKKELEESKVGFLSIASHQLRTPLSITKWVLDSLSRDTGLTDGQRKKINDLVYSNERLINLVEDLLHVSMIETGGLVVNKKMINLSKIINDLASSFKIIGDKKNKILKINIPHNLEMIYCDPILIHESIENLINNAFLYSKKDSTEIKLTVLKRNDDYLISIHNEGVIDDESMQKMKVFDKFSRGPNSSEIEPSGSGLGLYITKKMIEANGGTIWFESSTEYGTTFNLTIIKNYHKL